MKYCRDSFSVELVSEVYPFVGPETILGPYRLEDPNLRVFFHYSQRYDCCCRRCYYSTRYRDLSLKSYYQLLREVLIQHLGVHSVWTDHWLEPLWNRTLLWSVVMVGRAQQARIGVAWQHCLNHAQLSVQDQNLLLQW